MDITVFHLQIFRSDLAHPQGRRAAQLMSSDLRWSAYDNTDKKQSIVNADRIANKWSSESVSGGEKTSTFTINVGHCVEKFIQEPAVFLISYTAALFARGRRPIRGFCANRQTDDGLWTDVSR